MIRTGGGGNDPGEGGSGDVEIRNRNLVVEGSGQKDNIVISKSGSNTKVKLNGDTTTVKSSLFDQIIVRAFAGNDVVSVSSPKRTRVEAGDGNDNVLTGKNRDTILGGAGSDTLRGRNGEDLIEGGDGSDLIYGDGQDDTIIGGAGSDSLFAGSGRDRVLAGGGADILIGDSGSDELNGGSGRDILIGGNGADTLNGGASDDILIGGRTKYDGSVSALTSLRAEWNASGRSYASRVDAIRRGKGSTKGKKLTNSTVRADSGERDILTGGAGRDWFFREFDTLVDRKADEERSIFE